MLTEAEETLGIVVTMPMMMNKLMQLKRITNGDRRRAIFVIFRKRNSFFNAICITFYTSLKPLQKTKLLKIPPPPPPPPLLSG